MKLGKTLDLSKCYYDKDHWTHPDLKEGQLYIVQLDNQLCWSEPDIIKLLIGLFEKDEDINWCFIPNQLKDSNDDYVELGANERKHPFQEGWKHIQEVIV